MALDITSMRKHRQKREDKLTGGGESEWFNPDVGEHLLYVAGVCRPKDDLNYVELSVHYNIGPNRNMVVSLDPQSNPVLKHPDVQEILDDKGISIGNCPVNREYLKRKNSGDDDGAKQISRSTKFIFNVIPIGKRSKATEKWSKFSDHNLMPYMVGPTVWEGILDIFFTEGDITDPEKAIFIRLSKTGKGLSTRYKISVDSESMRKPVNLGKDVQTFLEESLQKGGDGDLYAMVGNMVKSKEHVEHLFKGIPYDPDNDGYDNDDEDDSEEVSGDSNVEETSSSVSKSSFDDLDALERELSKRSRKKR